MEGLFACPTASQSPLFVLTLFGMPLFLLSSSSRRAYRFSGTDEDQVAEAAAAAAQALVKRENLVEACGKAASTLKSYQLVGINFLMMLHRSESTGGSGGEAEQVPLSPLVLLLAPA